MKVKGLAAAATALDVVGKELIHMIGVNDNRDDRFLSQRREDRADRLDDALSLLKSAHRTMVLIKDI